jgi:hypothetical protein
MSEFDSVPAYTIRVHRLDPTLAELRIAFADLPAEVEIRGRLMGPRCPGISTVEVAYPLQRLSHGVYRVLIPEPVYWTADRPCVYEGPAELRRQGEPPRIVTLSVGVRSAGS